MASSAFDRFALKVRVPQLTEESPNGVWFVSTALEPNPVPFVCSSNKVTDCSVGCTPDASLFSGIGTTCSNYSSLIISSRSGTFSFLDLKTDYGLKSRTLGVFSNMFFSDMRTASGIGELMLLSWQLSVKSFFLSGENDF